MSHNPSVNSGCSGFSNLVSIVNSTLLIMKEEGVCYEKNHAIIFGLIAYHVGGKC
jgi:hypothetical protein